ncbi:MAG: Protein GrpE [Parcubacteria group bacterium GW2011_GWE2_38_18]|nr:MAG: Protein GrpE [Parcubacteria group bacterium GW2011_GWE2_38_18]
MQNKKNNDQEAKDNDLAESVQEDGPVESAEKTIEEELAERCLEMENKYKRALADYQNLVKQTAQEKIETVRYANENLLYQILPVYDNLKISLNHINEDVEQSGWLVGVKHVIRQFKDVLAQLGVEEIDTSGKKFDHSTMEAIDKEITNDKKLNDIIAREVKSGYRLKDKVIAPAKVVVYEYKEKTEE